MYEGEEVRALILISSELDHILKIPSVYISLQRGKSHGSASPTTAHGHTAC